MPDDELTFEDADGVTVALRRWLPRGDARAIVVVVHGASEHSGRYARLADVLTNEGYAVYALDLRGHGRTADSTGPGRIGPRGMEGVFDDLRAVIGRGKQEHPNVPVVLFGHSMGSVITQGFVETHGDEVDAYVLSGTMGAAPGAADFAAAVREAVDAGMGDEPLDTLSSFNADFEPPRTAFDWLSRDPDEVDRYVADPLCGDDLPLTYGYVAAMLDTVATSSEPDQIARVPRRIPVLLVTGDADPVSNGAAHVRELEGRLRAAGLDVEAHYYPDARHEVLNETNRDEVHADVVAWLERVTAEKED
jgi:alpha-beta hydrolase superfamily lysophospholipase